MSGGMGGGEAGEDPPTTTKGDVSGFDTTFARIPIGSNDQVLTADSAQALGLKWATPTDIAPPTTTKGDLSGFSTAQARIPVGANATVLTADSTQALGLTWSAPAGAGKARFLGETILGTAGTNITLSGLSLDMEDDYSSIQVTCGWSTAGTRSNIGLQVNNVTSNSYQYIREDFGTMEAGTVNGSTIELIESGSSGTYLGGSTITIHRGGIHTAGRLMAHCQNFQHYDSSSLTQGYITAPDYTITEIDIIAGSNLNAGSNLRVTGILK